jgi:Arc/MetJ-type ribon-helix-helix transcriptional regulator
MPRVTAQISDDDYKKLEEEVKLGIFQNVSEAINAAIKKTYAKKSRVYLRWIIKKEGITEASMLEELKAIRR